MYLFIFESIGTSELIFVGLISLIFLEPRKLPGMAKRATHFLRAARRTSNDFKSTWAQEVVALELDTDLSRLERSKTII